MIVIIFKSMLSQNSCFWHRSQHWEVMLMFRWRTVTEWMSIQLIPVTEVRVKHQTQDCGFNLVMSLSKQTLYRESRCFPWVPKQHYLPVDSLTYQWTVSLTTNRTGRPGHEQCLHMRHTERRAKPSPHAHTHTPRWPACMWLHDATHTTQPAHTCHVWVCLN